MRGDLNFGWSKGGGEATSKKQGALLIFIHHFRPACLPGAVGCLWIAVPSWEEGYPPNNAMINWPEFDIGN